MTIKLGCDLPWLSGVRDGFVKKRFAAGVLENGLSEMGSKRLAPNGSKWLQQIGSRFVQSVFVFQQRHRSLEGRGSLLKIQRGSDGNAEQGKFRIPIGRSASFGARASFGSSAALPLSWSSQGRGLQCCCHSQPQARQGGAAATCRVMQAHPTQQGAASFFLVVEPRVLREEICTTHSALKRVAGLPDGI